jgi:tol-pal system protein YbgF
MKRIPYLFIVFVLGVASTTQAGTKEELMRLQADVLALRNQMQQFEKTLNERTDSIRSLVVQLNDQVGNCSLKLSSISSALEKQTTTDSSTMETALKDVKELASRLDDTNTRISALATQISEMNVQTKPLAQRAFLAAGVSPDGVLSPDQVFREADEDLIQGHFDLAIQGFNAFLTNFPTNDRADDAQYNVGVAFYNAQKYSESIAALTKVINEYSTGDKVAAALFKRAMAEMNLQQKDSAVADFRTLVNKYASSPEGNLAKAELSKMGIDASRTPARPAVKKS